MILLVDMDAFFASVEQAHHPHLRGKPVIVCGDPGRRGVVTAASYEARPFGVSAGMPLQKARELCPHAEYVEGNPEKYVGLSLQLLDLYVSFSPDVEPFSVDEAFVGLDRRLSLEQAAAVAADIQRAVDERFQLGASIGIGPNKLVAKMAAGLQKPRGLIAFDEEAFRETFWPREVQDLWGVGPKLATRMRSLGISTVGELARAPRNILQAAFGIIGPQLREAAWGKDETPLVPYHQGIDAKSMGHEVTLTENSVDANFLTGTLLRLSDQVARRLRGEGYTGRVVAIKLRDARFQTMIRQRALAGYTDEPLRIYEVARALFLEHWKRDSVRLIGVTVASLERRREEQAELFDQGKRQRDWRDALDRVRDKLGESSLVPAGTMTHRRELGHVPFGAVSPRTRPAGGASTEKRARAHDAARGDAPRNEAPRVPRSPGPRKRSSIPSS